MANRIPVRGRRGFTLLEVLLAFVVFAISFSVVLQILSGSMRSTMRARHYTEAALLAQSVMDMVGREIPLEETSLTGDEEGDYTWDLLITRYEPVGANDRSLVIAEVTGTEVYRVGLDLYWGSGNQQKNAHFSTIRSILANRQ
jgi:general secretion pathway protein I